jgi:hypothetical protein
VEAVYPVAHEGWDEPFGEGTDTAHESLVGTDPDVSASAGDAGWDAPDFPAPLEISVPEPVDGFPWSDSALLGDTGTDASLHDPAGYESAPPVSELLGYAGLDAGTGDPWAALLGSDDPAANALARWWTPGG